MRDKEAIELERLATEERNPHAARLDTLTAIEIARVINDEDAQVPFLVRMSLEPIAAAMEAIAEALGRGGRLLYVGAGTSGRIAALDAAEAPPTFNLPARAVQVVVAGGRRALLQAAEQAEDSRAAGVRDIARKKPTNKDVVVGLSASGRTRYTLAAVEYARRKGAKTVAVVCAPESPLAQAAEIAIEVVTGPEVVTGSTRMKAGTAQKLVLNMLSTGAMARLGYVYGDLMVNVHLKNRKLVERGLRALAWATGVPREAARRALRAAGNSVPVALVMLRTGAGRREAERRLKAARGNVRRAMENH